jgi:hypothetical protein
MTRTVTLTASAPTKAEMVLLECVARVCGVSSMQLGFGKVNDSEIAVGTISIRGGLGRSALLQLPAATVVGIVTTLVSSTAPELLPFSSSTNSGTDFAVATSWMTNASQTLGVLQVGEPTAVPTTNAAMEMAHSGTFCKLYNRCIYI